jgi:hypothetical protein
MKRLGHHPQFTREDSLKYDKALRVLGTYNARNFDWIEICVLSFAKME